MTVSQFRKDLKAHFDAALAGEPVYVVRGGVTYNLVALNISLTKEGRIHVPRSPKSEAAPHVNFLNKKAKRR